MSCPFALCVSLSLQVALAMCLVLAAALCKEIGITAVGCMALYDICLVPLTHNTLTGPSSKQDTTTDAHTQHSSETQSSKGSTEVPGRSTWCVLLCQPVWLRLLMGAVTVVGYVKMRSFLAGDQLVRIYRKVRRLGLRPCMDPHKSRVCFYIGTQGMFWPV